MYNCEAYKNLNDEDQEVLFKAIKKRMMGRSNIADWSVFDSEFYGYQFYIEVYKFNSRRGWVTRGLAKRKKNGGWSISLKIPDGLANGYRKSAYS